MSIIRRERSKLVSLTLAVVLLLGMVLGASPVYANDVEATGASLTGQNTAEGSTNIQFDIAWDHSWRDAVNWDAVWVFAKYQTSDSELWQHATLATEGHTAPAGAVIEVPSDGMGAFIYRAEEGGGPVDYDGVQLKWLYGTDGLADDAVVTVKVFAIEMVYIPSGEFYLGDIGDEQRNCFYDGGGGPYLVTSEEAIVVEKVEGALFYDRDNVYGGDQQGPIPAEFPKGYDAFYVMKYEASQRQYAEFLNTLTPAELLNRNPAANLEFETGEPFRYYIEEQDGIFGCDANGNDILNEADDGEWIACLFVGWPDVAGYADWAGLRGMTEFEFTKACRGDQEVVDNEYAWGNAEIIDSVSAGQVPSNPGMANEAGAVTGTGLCSFDSDGSNAPGGPLRSGFAATDTTDRLTSSASYYGVMDMSGNLWELCVSPGKAEGRAYAGTHGDGILYDGEGFEGNATNTDWPAYKVGEGVSLGDGTAEGVGTRGGSWGSVLNISAEFQHVANRGFGAYSHTGRPPHFGFRCVRTA